MYRLENLTMRKMMGLYGIFHKTKIVINGGNEIDWLVQQTITSRNLSFNN